MEVTVIITEIVNDMGLVHRKLLIGRVKMLLRKNCGILVSESEIDTSITISENYFILRDKYTCKSSYHNINDYI